MISESRKYGVQLILGLVNNWNDLGGKNKYVQWARERGENVTGDNDFFTHSVVRQYYKNHVKVSYFSNSIYLEYFSSMLKYNKIKSM